MRAGCSTYPERNSLPNKDATLEKKLEMALPGCVCCAAALAEVRLDSSAVSLAAAAPLSLLQRVEREEGEGGESVYTSFRRLELPSPFHLITVDVQLVATGCGHERPGRNLVVSTGARGSRHTLVRYIK